MQCLCEIFPQAAATVAVHRKAEPVLPNLREAIPEPQQVLADRPTFCFRPQENEISNDAIMQVAIVLLLTVE